MASKPHSWGLWGPVAEAAMETRIENLECKMDEVEQLLKGKSWTQAQLRSPLRQEHRRMRKGTVGDGRRADHKFCR